MKTCNNCGKEKDDTNFTRGKGTCKICRSELRKQSYKVQVQKQKEDMNAKLAAEKAERKRKKAEEEELNRIAREKDVQRLKAKGLTDRDIEHQWLFYRNGKRCLW